MGVDERLVKDQIRAAKEAAREPYYAAEPDWMIYKEKEKKPWFNKDRGVFTETGKKSINKAPSVFEAGALFDTKGNENDGSQI